MFKTAGLTLFSRLVSAILFFGLIVAVSRLLGPAERGICALYLLIVAMVVGISDIAGGAASAYLLRNFQPFTLLRKQMFWAIFPAIIVPCLFYYFADLSEAETTLLIIVSWAHSGWNMQQHLLLGMKKFLRFNLFNLSVPILACLFFLVLWQLGFRERLTYLVSLGLAWIVAFLFGFQYLLKFSENSSERPANGESGQIFRLGFLNQVSHLVSIFNGRLIFFILPATTLGLFSNALTIVEALFLIPGSLGQILYALLARDDRDEFKNHYFKRVWWGNIIIMTTGCLFVALLPEYIWLFLFGQHFEGIKPILLALLPGAGLYSLFLVISYRQSSGGKFIHNLWALLAGLLLNCLITGFFLFTNTYTLPNGILALIAGWGGAAFAAVLILRRTNPIAFKGLLSPPWSVLKFNKMG